MSILMSFICVCLCIYDKCTGNVLESGQMMIAAGCFAIAANLSVFKINSKEIEDEERDDLS